MSINDRVAELDRQITALKADRDELIRESGMEGEQLKRILRARSPKQTLCQMLRELYNTVTVEQRETVGRCLLVAKRMDDKLVEYAGKGYAGDWYD